MTRTPLDLDRGADLQIEAPLVPESLQHLIPLAARWAFEAQNDQDDFVKRMLSERTTEVAAFNAAIDTHRTDIVQWATEAGFDKHKTQLSEADWAHPYWHFLTLLKIRELTGPAPEAWPGQAAALRERIAVEARDAQFARAWPAADEAFRSADYAVVVHLLTPFEDLLTTSQKSKLAIARKRSGAA